MKRKIIVALGTIAVLLAFVPVVSAASTQYYPGPTNCQNTPIRAYLWENDSADHTDGDDRLAMCLNGGQFGVTVDLLNVLHTLPGVCDGPWTSDGYYWGDDCIESVTWYVPSGWTACVYDGDSWLSRVLIASRRGPVSGVRTNIVVDEARYFGYYPDGCR